MYYAYQQVNLICAVCKVVMRSDPDGTVVCMAPRCPEQGKKYRPISPAIPLRPVIEERAPVGKTNVAMMDDGGFRG